EQVLTDADHHIRASTRAVRGGWPQKGSPPHAAITRSPRRVQTSRGSAASRRAGAVFTGSASRGRRGLLSRPLPVEPEPEREVLVYAPLPRGYGPPPGGAGTDKRATPGLRRDRGCDPHRGHVDGRPQHQQDVGSPAPSEGAASEEAPVLRHH